MNVIESSIDGDQFKVNGKEAQQWLAVSASRTAL